MAPLPLIVNPSIKTELNSPATQLDVQAATEAISQTLRIAILILAGLTVATAGLYFILRRRRSGRLAWPATPRLVYESSVSIEFDDVEDARSVVIEVGGLHGYCTPDTVLSPHTPRGFAFDSSKATSFLERQQPGILDRRGKMTLQCDTSAYYETDLIPTKSQSPIARRHCRPKVHFTEDKDSPISALWSKHTGFPSPFSRPRFGFNAMCITPPSDNPMWKQRQCMTP